MFQRSTLTNQVYDLFKGANDTLSYERLTTETGRNLEELRPTLGNVRKMLERDEGIVFETMRGVGFRRLSDGEKVTSAQAFTRQIHRASNRGTRRLDAVHNAAALSPREQADMTIRKTIFEAVRKHTNADKEKS